MTQTQEIRWLPREKELERHKDRKKTLKEEGKEKMEYGYYISSLRSDIKLFSGAVALVSG